MTGIAVGLLAASLGIAGGVEPQDVDIAETVFDGRGALRVKHRGQHGFALVSGVEFRDGEIEVEVAGTVDPDASWLMRRVARGFIGLAFRVDGDSSHYEVIYLRPTNGRSDDQVRRNHSVQYASVPDYGWRRLRAESPGKYESYADLQPAHWTKMRIVVRGRTASLFVGSAPQPCLVVNDLKLGSGGGEVGLWVGSGTVGYFRDLRITPAEEAR